jgi:hypothetical protein
VSILRWLGLAVGAGVLLHAFARFRGGRSRRMDFALATLFGAGLVTVSAYPDSVNALRDMLMLEHAQWSRLIAVLIASNLLLWLVLLATRAGGWLVRTPRLSLVAHGAGDLTAALFLAHFLRLGDPASVLAATAAGVHAVLEETLRRRAGELQIVAAQDALLAREPRFRVEHVF